MPLNDPKPKNLGRSNLLPLAKVTSKLLTNEVVVVSEDYGYLCH